MPELPEVETTRRALLPALHGQRISEVLLRCERLRYPLSPELPGQLVGQRLLDIERRGKYLLFRFERGTLLVHLGMSGSLRLLTAEVAAQAHDHVDLLFGRAVLRYHDPRRFGAMLWIGEDVANHPLIAPLGIEPLSDAFEGRWLHAASRGRRLAIKPFLMDSRVVVGIGNIYASESLFRAGVAPTVAAGRLSLPRCERLVAAIRATLDDALRAGGSTLRDFAHSDGSPGAFQQQLRVYGRAGEPCRNCGRAIRELRMGQRSTFYCAHCQRR